MSSAPKTNSFGKYQVIRSIGKGGMGEVFLARDPGLDREVAIKIVHPHLVADASFVARFQREARIVAQLRHPNIVPLFEFDASHDPPYMVMPYVKGDSLKTHLAHARETGRNLPLAEAARILDGVAAGLDKAHERAIVHRDLKPANILLDEDGNPLLTDFGIAKLLADSAQTAQLSAPDSTLGTASYMSPEQAASRPVDARSDLYSLGVTLFEMVAGRLPFSGDSAMAVMMKHLTEPPPDARSVNPSLPAAVSTLLMRALAKEPAARFASAGDLARAFRAAISEPSAAQGPPAAAIFDALTQPDNPPVVAAVLAGAGMASAAALASARPAGARHKLIVFANGLAEAIGANKTASALGAISIIVAALELLNRIVGMLDRLLGTVARGLPYLTVLLFAAGLVAVLITARRKPEYRRAALSFVGVIGAAGVVWVGWSIYDVIAPRSGFSVAIADFDRRQAREFLDVTERVYSAMRNGADELGGALRVERAGEAYPDRSAAQAAAAQRRFNWMVWGSYDDKGVLLNVDPANSRALGIETLSINLSGAVSASNAKPAAQRIQRTLGELREASLSASGSPEQINYFANLALGLVYLGNDDAARASRALSAAIQRTEATARAGGAAIAGGDIAYYYRGLLSLSQGLVAQGVKDLEAAASMRPASADTRYALAVGYSQTCDPATRGRRALEEVQEAIRLDPTRVSSQLLEGDLRFEQMDFARALAAYSQARAMDPNRIEVFERLEAVYTALGRGAEAAAARASAGALRQSLSAIASNTLDAQIARGYAALNAGDTVAAQAALGAARLLSPTHRATLIGMGAAQLAALDSAAAMVTLQPLIQANPKDGLALKLLGVAFSRARNNTEAVALFTRGAEASPCDPNAQALLGGALFEAKNYSDASKAFRSQAEMRPNDADAWFSVGNALLFSCGSDKTCRDLDDAAMAFGRASEITPTSFSVNLALGSVYDLQDKPDKAAAAWERGLTGARTAAEKRQLLESLGTQYAKLLQWPRAELAYRQAISITRVPESQRGLIQALFAQNKYNDTIGEARALLESVPDDGMAKSILASSLATRAYASLTSWRIDDAANDLRSALAAQPRNADRLFLLSLTEYARCSLDEAARAGAEAASLNPAYRYWLGDIARAQGRLDDAAAVYAELARSPLTRTADHLSRASDLLAQGKWDDAASIVLLALPSATNANEFARGHEILAGVYAEKRNLSAARSELLTSLRAAPDYAPALLALGDIALMTGDLNEAFSRYTDAGLALPAFTKMNWVSAALIDVNLPLRAVILYKRLNQPGEAERALDDARARATTLVRLAPGLSAAQFALGFALAERGDKAGSEAAFAAAVRCDAGLVAERARFEAWLARMR